MDTPTANALQAILALSPEQQAQLSRVQARLLQIEQEDTGLPDADVVLKDLPAQLALSLREVIPTGQHIATLLMESGMAVMGQQVKLTSPPMTIFHDPDFKETDLEIELAFPLEDKHEAITLASGRTLTPRSLEAAQMASIIHTGDYSRFAETYELIGRWIERNDYQIAGASREIYLRPPSETEPAITEIQFPVER